PRRLTYPELLQKQNYNNHIYDNDTELYDKVKYSIINIGETRKIEISASFKQYDWKIICPEYDGLLTLLIK
ncbi:MAG: hypothetical protein VX731_01370, partial [Candidatus Neomarinimicrobiota bacterium]|nr:hypothetical protein [Candidatus Neomarinimicrobiota bacterium]